MHERTHRHVHDQALIPGRPATGTTDVPAWAAIVDAGPVELGVTGLAWHRESDPVPLIVHDQRAPGRPRITRRDRVHTDPDTGVRTVTEGETRVLVSAGLEVTPGDAVALGRTLIALGALARDSTRAAPTAVRQGHASWCAHDDEDSEPGTCFGVERRGRLSIPQGTDPADFDAVGQDYWIVYPMRRAEHPDALFIGHATLGGMLLTPPEAEQLITDLRAMLAQLDPAAEER